MCVLRPTIGEWTLCHRLQRRPATCLRVLVGPARRTGIKVTATAPPNHGRIGSWRSQSCRLDHPNRNYRPLVGDNERRQEIVRRTHLLPKHTLRMAHWRETGRGCVEVSGLCSSSTPARRVTMPSHQGSTPPARAFQSACTTWHWCVPEIV